MRNKTHSLAAQITGELPLKFVFTVENYAGNYFTEMLNQLQWPISCSLYGQNSSCPYILILLLNVIHWVLFHSIWFVKGISWEVGHLNSSNRMHFYDIVHFQMFFIFSKPKHSEIFKHDRYFGIYERLSKQTIGTFICIHNQLLIQTQTQTKPCKNYF